MNVLPLYSPQWPSLYIYIYISFNGLWGFLDFLVKVTKHVCVNQQHTLVLYPSLKHTMSWLYIYIDHSGFSRSSIGRECTCVAHMHTYIQLPILCHIPRLPRIITKVLYHHSSTRTYEHTYTCTPTHRRTDAHRRTQAHRRTSTHVSTPIHTDAHRRTSTHTNARKYTDTHRRTSTHIRTPTHIQCRWHPMKRICSCTSKSFRRTCAHMRLMTLAQDFFSSCQIFHFDQFFFWSSPPL